MAGYTVGRQWHHELPRDEILFGPDETTSPRLKRFLSTQGDQVPYSTFTMPRMPGSKRLEAILGDKRFPYPKDERGSSRWIGAVADSSALVLDFFGGSGTTTEAVMRLNEEDGGTRQVDSRYQQRAGCEGSQGLTKAGHRRGDVEWEARGVHEYVTRPRLTTVVTGEALRRLRTYEDTVPANVEFFTLTYEAPLRVASNREFGRIAPLLWMRAGSRGRRIDDIAKGWDVADAYGVIADFDHSDEFLQALSDQPDAAIAFVVTDDDWLFESMCRELPERVEPVRLYEAYLRNFELESGRGAR